MYLSPITSKIFVVIVSENYYLRVCIYKQLRMAASHCCILRHSSKIKNMPRRARIVSHSGLYHIMLRGVNRQNIFNDEDDYSEMVDILSHLHIKTDGTGLIVTERGCSIYAYCLMSNHLHLLIREKDLTISEIVKTLASKYVYYFNHRHQRIGHLFQDRFKSEPVEDLEYFIQLLRYIHQNPVKAGMTKNISEYRWSSWHEYLHPSELHICDVNAVLKYIPMGELRYFVNAETAVPNDITDIECEKVPAKAMMTDAEVTSGLLHVSGCKSIMDFRNLHLSERRDAVQQLRELGAGVNQLARITGLSAMTISRATK